MIALGSGSSPQGVIQGPEPAEWSTDGGLQAIVRVAGPAHEVRLFRLASGTPCANPDTGAVDGGGELWFVGQSGLIGRVTIKTGQAPAQQRAQPFL